MKTYLTTLLLVTVANSVPAKEIDSPPNKEEKETGDELQLHLLQMLDEARTDERSFPHIASFREELNSFQLDKAWQRIGEFLSGLGSVSTNSRAKSAASVMRQPIQAQARAATKNLGEHRKPKQAIKEPDSATPTEELDWALDDAFEALNRLEAIIDRNLRRKSKP